MVAFTKQVPIERKRESVDAPELGEGVEIVVSEITALELAKYRNFALEAEARQRKNGEYHEDLGIQGIAELLQYAIIDPDTGERAFTRDDLYERMKEGNFGAFHRAFKAALGLNGVSFVETDEASAEGNSGAIPTAELPTGLP